MNANFKPLGIAAAVAAASYAGVANAQTAALNAEENLGDLAIVPYYTVMDGYATGVNIINTSNKTQVLKFRFRRAVDSMDAMDFNVVLSPEDMYTGFISQIGDDIVWTSNDESCVAPGYDYSDNQFLMPILYRDGAETGYIEIISMGAPIDEDQPIAKSALHDSDGVPASCQLVRDNFFANDGTLTKRGVISSVQTHQRKTDADGVILSTVESSTFEAAVDSLKVSYFIKSDVTGVEFGDNAVHITDFLNGASMTNQQQGIFSGDLQGFDHPDLNGGAPASVIASVPGAAERGKFLALRDILGSKELINDWSQNSTGTFSVDTDWVVTYPGQYVMLDLPQYLSTLVPGSDEVCLRAADVALYNLTAPAGSKATACDWRDIPMTASFKVIDREEQGITVEEGDLVVSPQPPVINPTDLLDKEVNVIQWGEAPVLNAPAFLEVPKPDGAAFGFARLSTESADANLGVCDFAPTGNIVDGKPEIDYVCVSGVNGSAPVVGFVAWQRNFADLPAANYGRIVAHSRTQASS